MSKQEGSKIVALVVMLRLPQWVKNAFVLAPLLFSGKFTDQAMCLKSGRAFLSFCLISSAVYILNDLCDRQQDQNHPTKKLRPIASGAVNYPQALAVMLLFALASLILASGLNHWCSTLIGLYALINIIYSLGLKHVAILDVMAIAAGFVLRILAGSAVIGATPSHWIILCTIMISMFLGFTKRRAELAAIETHGSRTVLKDYSVIFLDQVIAVVTGATLICYALYTVDSQTIALFKTKAMIVTVPCVTYGLFRYIYIIYHLKEGQDPSRTLSRDWPTMINVVLWAILALLVVNYGTEMAKWF